MGAITELFYVNNFSSSTLTITNVENGFSRSCPAGMSTLVSYQWVPWCSKGADFATHHIALVVSGVTFFMWQDTDTDGNWVPLSTTGFVSSANPPFNAAPRFPGVAMDGGDRNIDVSPGGRKGAAIVLPPSSGD